MVVNLNRDEIIALLKTTRRKYGVDISELADKCGYYERGFNNLWVWNDYIDNYITDEQIYEIYLNCREF